MTDRVHAKAIQEKQCSKPALCPLNQVRAGSVVCIKQLAASAEMTGRLREMGFCEEQEIKLLSREGNIICLVCNARLGISEKLAATIMVSTPARLLKVA